jgi:hypothetical protein
MKSVYGCRLMGLNVVYENASAHADATDKAFTVHAFREIGRGAGFV